VKRLVSLVAAIVTGFAVMVVAAPAALAQPTNDDFAGATVIGSVPFSINEDTSSATWDPSDPPDCSSNGSVWFSFTPQTDMQIIADTTGSDYFPSLSAWTGTQGALTRVACDEFDIPSRVHFRATAGTTYYFLVAACCGSGGNFGGNLQFHLTEVFPPANDNFADATPITALPFDQTMDLTGATTEPGEPNFSCGVNLQNTAWFSFTPDTTESLTLQTNMFGTGFRVYTGSSLSQLQLVICSGFGTTPGAFRAEAGTTYYIQVGMSCCGDLSPVTLHVAIAPPPTAGFQYYPFDPSTFDTIQFFDQSSDPAGGQILTQNDQWDFGGGVTATGCCPHHQFPTDGDYPVSMTATTLDGRSDSITRVIQVRTHDVAIIDISVPNTAHVGQTISITVLVRNKRYPETVQMDLGRATPFGSFDQVGTLTQAVPVRPPGGTSTKFAFSYTVTGSDGSIGKITFRAAATIIGARDALAGDNVLIAAPVKVT